jgi:hypothetical protein
MPMAASNTISVFMASRPPFDPVRLSVACPDRRVQSQPGHPGRGPGSPRTVIPCQKKRHSPPKAGFGQFSWELVNWFTYARNNTLHSLGYRMA